MIEIIRPRPATRPRAVVFDFDGTLSLVRSGWQSIMRDVMLEALLAARPAEAVEALAARVGQTIERLTGHPTALQMEWLSAEVGRLGGRPLGPEDYKARYLEVLHARVAERLGALQQGHIGADDLLVPGSRALLEALRQRGVTLVLASGSDRPDVLFEAEALAISGYFGGGVYGPKPHAPDFSKQAVVQRMLAEQRIAGPQLVAIGDGPAEILAAQSVGGVTVGVAFDELRGAGLDARKRAQLIEIGADMIVPDFADDLVEYLFRATDDQSIAAVARQTAAAEVH